jgi:anti-anti-sigma factor
MGPTPTGRSGGLFDIEREGDTLIVTPQANLRELAYPEIEEGAREVLALLESGAARNVIMDFHRTDYYGSSALEFFIRLWKRVRGRNGQLVFCRASSHELEVLKLINLDRLWPICRSRREALETVEKGSAG